jgi:hypothetical protein
MEDLANRAVDLHVFEPVLIGADTNCAVAVLGFEVTLPGVGRFQDVAVGIDHG